MTTKAADDYESIARRLKELEADQQLALTGSSAPVTGQEAHKSVESVYGIDYSAFGASTFENANLPAIPLAHPGWPYAGTAHEWRGFVNQK